MRPRQPIRSVPPAPKRAIRQSYELHGVECYYERSAGEYRNPHEPAIRKLLGIVVARWHLDLAAVLDLACGSGEATIALRDLGAKQIQGMDPYTGAAYQQRTGQTAETYAFADIAGGVLAGRKYSLIVSSFALHLAPVSRLPRIAFALSQIAPCLLLLTPHKRPQLRPEWGWRLAHELVIERVRARLFRSSCE